MTLNMSLLVLGTLSMGGQPSAQVHTAPRLHQASDSEMCVGTLKAYTVRTSVKIFFSISKSLWPIRQCDTMYIMVLDKGQIQRIVFLVGSNRSSRCHFVFLSVCLSICLSVFWSVCLSGTNLSKALNLHLSSFFIRSSSYLHVNFKLSLSQQSFS